MQVSRLWRTVAPLAFIAGLLAATQAAASDGCAKFERAKQLGVLGEGGAQATVAFIYAFDLQICPTVVADDPRNDMRAYAWLTNDAVAFIANMPPAEKAATYRGLTQPPQVNSPAVQAALDARYAERKSLLSLDHLRGWLRSRMTTKQIEDARTLRRVLGLR